MRIVKMGLMKDKEEEGSKIKVMKVKAMGRKTNHWCTQW
jgi:hypothetical protein